MSVSVVQITGLLWRTYMNKKISNTIIISTFKVQRVPAFCVTGDSLCVAGDSLWVSMFFGNWVKEIANTSRKGQDILHNAMFSLCHRMFYVSCSANASFWCAWDLKQHQHKAVWLSTWATMSTDLLMLANMRADACNRYR